MKKLLICSALALLTTACSGPSANHSQQIAWDSMTYSTRTAVAVDHGFMRMGK